MRLTDAQIAVIALAQEQGGSVTVREMDKTREIVTEPNRVVLQLEKKGILRHTGKYRNASVIWELLT